MFDIWLAGPAADQARGEPLDGDGPMDLDDHFSLAKFELAAGATADAFTQVVRLPTQGFDEPSFYGPYPHLDATAGYAF